MRARFSIPVKTFSVNKMYWGDGRTKTQEAREWSHTVFHYLDAPDIQEQFKSLREYFDPVKHRYVVRLKAFYPESVIYTKEGAMSSRCHDVTNWEKPLIDLMFLPVHGEKPNPYGVMNLMIDDKHLVRLTSSKHPSDDGECRIEVWIRVINK